MDRTSHTHWDSPDLPGTSRICRSATSMGTSGASGEALAQQSAGEIGRYSSPPRLDQDTRTGSSRRPTRSVLAFCISGQSPAALAWAAVTSDPASPWTSGGSRYRTPPTWDVTDRKGLREISGGPRYGRRSAGKWRARACSMSFSHWPDSIRSRRPWCSDRLRSRGVGMGGGLPRGFWAATGKAGMGRRYTGEGEGGKD